MLATTWVIKKSNRSLLYGLIVMIILITVNIFIVINIYSRLANPNSIIRSVVDDAIEEII